MSIQDTAIWDEHGQLVPLDRIKRGPRTGIAAIIVNRDRPDLTDMAVENIKSDHWEVDTYVIEMGSTQCSKYMSFHYDDPDYRGKCYGHNVGLRYALSQGDYRYYLIAMNDVFLTTGSLDDLIKTMEINLHIGLLSPSEPEGTYPDCKPRTKDFHHVSTFDYLYFVMRHDNLFLGFINPSFKYCWGAIHELAYKYYQHSLYVTYDDTVHMKHFGGTTYGKVKNVISRLEYRTLAKQFAARYYVENYGKNWDIEFSACLPPEINLNTFKLHRQLWEKALDEKERIAFHDSKDLHPWYYPVKIRGTEITPGLGSKQNAQDLIERTMYRHELLVTEASKHYDFKNKTILDLGCNCGYWSARYTELGAIKVHGIDGRYTNIQQAYRYWQSNNFLPESSYNFLPQNIMTQTCWLHLPLAKFDFCLCAGILYHIPDYEWVVRQIDRVVKEAILIDTRITNADQKKQEPGGWCFDAITETSLKTVPSSKKLFALLQELGYNIVELKTNKELPKAMQATDNYNAGRRVCWLAVKK